MRASSLLSSLDGGEHDLVIRYLLEADQRLNCTRLARLEAIAACSAAPLFDAKLLVRRHLFLAHNRNASLSSAATTVKHWILESFVIGLPVDVL